MLAYRGQVRRADDDHVPVMTPTVVLAMYRGFDPPVFAADEVSRVREVARLADLDPLDEFTSTRARRLLAEADVLLAHWGCPPIDDAALDLAPRLGLVAYAAGSVRGVVTPAVWQRGITVTSAAAANAVPVAEYTLAAILLANKGALAAVQHRPGGAPPPRPRTVGNYRRRVGVVGASNVGRRLLRMLDGFDLETVVHDPWLDDAEADALHTTRVGLDELCATSDVVSVHVPELPATRHLIGADQLALMADGTTLINTSRGSLVDAAALEPELVTGRLSAVLDVTDPEPLPPFSPLWSLPNVALTPHLAGSLDTELARLADAAVGEVARFAAGLPPRHPVHEADLDRIA